MDAGDIEAVAALTDPVLRNLRITQTYSELSTRTTEVLGVDGASWTAFAVWASKSVGAAIRGEAVPAWLRAVSEASAGWRIADADPPPLPPWLARWHAAVGDAERSRLFDAYDGLCTRVSEHLALGNLLVFREVAPLYVRFCDAPDEDVDVGAGDRGGSAELAHAFANYRAARTAAAEEAAQLVLGANLQVGLHEQERLQAQIAAAVDQPVSWVPDGGHHAGLAGIAERDFRRFWEHQATALGMLLASPEGPLHPGADVPPPPAPPSGRPLYPAALTPVTDPLALAILHTYDRSDGAGHGTAADDWVQLADRMNFIGNLFRSRQAAPAWRSAPFTVAQVAQLTSGRRPEGPL